MWRNWWLVWIAALTFGAVSQPTKSEWDLQRVRRSGIPYQQLSYPISKDKTLRFVSFTMVPLSKGEFLIPSSGEWFIEVVTKDKISSVMSSNGVSTNAFVITAKGRGRFLLTEALHDYSSKAHGYGEIYPYQEQVIDCQDNCKFYPTTCIVNISRATFASTVSQVKQLLLDRRRAGLEAEPVEDDVVNQTAFDLMIGAIAGNKEAGAMLTQFPLKVGGDSAELLRGSQRMWQRARTEQCFRK